MTVKRIYQSDVKVSKEEELWMEESLEKAVRILETPASHVFNPGIWRWIKWRNSIELANSNGACGYSIQDHLEFARNVELSPTPDRLNQNSAFYQVFQVIHIHAKIQEAVKEVSSSEES